MLVGKPCALWRASERASDGVEGEPHQLMVSLWNTRYLNDTGD